MKLNYLIEEAIRPICEAFGIKNYDYNSIWAVQKELIGWIYNE